MSLKIPCWARPASAAEWHSARFNGIVTATPICGTLPAFSVFDTGDGTATLPMNTGAQFGPVCAACARLEGYGIEEG